MVLILFTVCIVAPPSVKKNGGYYQQWLKKLLNWESIEPARNNIIEKPTSSKSLIIQFFQKP